jgi:heterodisulfide reductase subunit A-like polyferredoxin
LNGEKFIGVFLCSCAENISGLLDIKRLQAEITKIKDVAFVAEHNLLCGKERGEVKLKLVEIGK